MDHCFNCVGEVSTCHYESESSWFVWMHCESFDMVFLRESYKFKLAFAYLRLELLQRATQLLVLQLHKQS